jgi:hypothetical protein
MFERRIILILVCLLVALASACGESQRPAGNVSSAPTQTTPAPARAEQQQQQQPPSPEASQVAPPTSATELREVVTRIYKNAVIVDENRKDAFVVGDFNGDNSQDIAIAVKPGKGMLSELNSEYANWILEDPQTVHVMELHKDVQKFPEKPAPVVVRQSDKLLAVIHGHQETGWRNPKATQTYLLRNAAGDAMQMQSARALRSVVVERGQLPPIRGDVIRETLADTPGIIYWTGAKYAWYPTAESQ